MLLEVGLLCGAIVSTRKMQGEVDALGQQSMCKLPLNDKIHNNTPDLSKYERYIDIIPIIIGLVAIDSHNWHLKPG